MPNHARLKSSTLRAICTQAGWKITPAAFLLCKSPRSALLRFSADIAERIERCVPSRLLSVEQIAEAVMRLATDRSLMGRVLVWWSEDDPGLIEWGDRGYRNFVSVRL